MKAGVYVVRGTNGPGKTDEIQATVSQGADERWCARFDWNGIVWLYGERPLSPHPERLEPKRASVDTQPVAASIAKAALRAAFSADVREKQEQEKVAHHDLDTDDDVIVMSAMRGRSAGPDEGRYTRNAR